MRPAPKPFPALAHRRNPWPAWLLLLALGSNGGCALVKGVLELPDKALRAVVSFNKGEETIDPVELQSQLIRFSDHFLNVVNSTTGRLQRDGEESRDRRSSLQRRIGITDDVLSIATGSNPYANLLDMLILVTLGRMNVEDFWMPKHFGESARPLLNATLGSEKEIWRIAEQVLKKNQIEELRNAISAWHGQHPEGLTPRDVGALGFATEIGRMNRTTESETASVFNLLMIDPLSRLDPATRELANTRLAAERGLFLARHLPTLVRWEAELLAIQTAQLPQSEKMLADLDRLSESADRFGKLAEQFPEILHREREHIVDALNSQRHGLTHLAAQTEKTFSEGRLMSDAVNAALMTFQGLFAQIEASPSNPDSEPFRIVDYAETATRIADAAQQLSAMLDTFNQTLSPERLEAFSARIEALSRQTQAGGRDLVDYAFTRTLILGSILIAMACAMALASIMAYWALKRRFGVGAKIHSPGEPVDAGNEGN